MSFIKWPLRAAFALALAGVSVANAGVITSNPITGDADSGIGTLG